VIVTGPLWVRSNTTSVAVWSVWLRTVAALAGGNDSILKRALWASFVETTKVVRASRTLCIHRWEPTHNPKLSHDAHGSAPKIETMGIRISHKGPLWPIFARVLHFTQRLRFNSILFSLFLQLATKCTLDEPPQSRWVVSLLSRSILCADIYTLSRLRNLNILNYSLSYTPLKIFEPQTLLKWTWRRPRP
jgi:hypothetical protein